MARWIFWFDLQDDSKISPINYTPLVRAFDESGKEISKEVVMFKRGSPPKDYRRKKIRHQISCVAPSLPFSESSLPFRAPHPPASFVLFHHPRFPLPLPPLLGRSLNTPKHLSQSDHVRAFPISLASVETVEWIEVRDRNVWSVRTLTARVAHHAERSLPKAMLSNFDRSTAIYYERRRMNCTLPVGPSAKAFKKGPFKSGSTRYAGVKFPFETCPP